MRDLPTADVRALASKLWHHLIRRPLGALFHRARHRVAVRRLRGRSVRSIVFVCHGNICRSPYAEGAFRRLMLGNSVPGLKTASAGFVAPGRPAPPAARVVAGRRGVDLSHHRSELINPERAREADLVVVMDARQKWAVHQRFGKRQEDILILADLLPAFGGTRAIRDPVDQPLEVFEQVYDHIDVCLTALVAALTAGERR